jgi:hypothetical protein
LKRVVPGDECPFELFLDASVQSSHVR